MRNFFVMQPSRPALLPSRIIAVYVHPTVKVVWGTEGHRGPSEEIVLLLFLIWGLGYPDGLILWKYIRLYVYIYDLYTFQFAHNILVESLSRKSHNTQTHCTTSLSQSLPFGKLWEKPCKNWVTKTTFSISWRLMVLSYNFWNPLWLVYLLGASCIRGVYMYTLYNIFLYVRLPAFSEAHLTETA